MMEKPGGLEDLEKGQLELGIRGLPQMQERQEQQLLSVWAMLHRLEQLGQREELVVLLRGKAANQVVPGLLQVLQVLELLLFMEQGMVG